MKRYLLFLLLLTSIKSISQTVDTLNPFHIKNYVEISSEIMFISSSYYDPEATMCHGCGIYSQTNSVKNGSPLPGVGLDYGFSGRTGKSTELFFNLGVFCDQYGFDLK